jgi:hypothetical protein
MSFNLAFNGNDLSQQQTFAKFEPYQQIEKIFIITLKIWTKETQDEKDTDFDRRFYRNNASGNCLRPL